MFAQIVRFTRVPDGVEGSAREAWEGLEVPATEFSDTEPNRACFTTRLTLYQALLLTGHPEAAEPCRVGHRKANELILIDDQDVEVVDDRPAFWVDSATKNTLHHLMMVTPGTTLLTCGLRIGQRPAVVAFTTEWFYMLRESAGYAGSIAIPGDVADALNSEGSFLQCGSCKRLALSESRAGLAQTA